MTDMLFRWSLYLVAPENHSPCIMSSHLEVIYVCNSINIYFNLINTVKSECDGLNLNTKTSFKGFWLGKTCMKIIDYVKHKVCVCSYSDSI